MAVPDDTQQLIAQLREALTRLTELHAAEMSELRARHAAVIDALTKTYRDEIARLTAELGGDR